MGLSKKQISDVCYINGGAYQCRYLDEEFDDQENIVNICRKKSVDKNIIDLEISDFVSKCIKEGTDPIQYDQPLADNCKGYLPLVKKQQGYDII